MGDGRWEMGDGAFKGSWIRRGRGGWLGRGKEVIFE
jgi:hypothetical protein